MTIRALREDEIDEHAELVYVSYTHEREIPPDHMIAHPDWWLRGIERDPYYTPEQTRVMEVDGVLVASVTCYQRATCMGAEAQGREAKVACIGSVCTHPDHRRKGHVREVLAEAAEWMAAEGYEWSFLYGKAEVYGGSGWRNLATWDTLADLAVREEWLGNATLREADPEDDLPLLMGIYEDFSGRMVGTTVRSEEYWRRRVLSATPWSGAPTYEIAEREGEPIGYVRMNGTLVAEIAWVGRPHDLLAEILHRAGGEPVHFGFSLPELTVALRDISAIPTQRECFDDAGGVTLREAYRGLWRSHASDWDTDALVAHLRDHDYVMWRADRA